MRKFLNKIIEVAILLACVFFAGAFTAGIRGWFAPAFEISVINNSGQHISDIEVCVETGHQKSISVLGALGMAKYEPVGSMLSESRRIENGQTRTYRFFVAGEGGYTLTATLGNGRKVSSRKYVGFGNSIEETVMADSIKSEISHIRL